ncbi:HD-GYP domain [hydrothermal vent metagenome]|uniref:histidine kinase n=1 Tax=hydrothermal vent metagenome TaxID=652676 RepID=A0A3B1CH22_9ZZZZ
MKQAQTVGSQKVDCLIMPKMVYNNPLMENPDLFEKKFSILQEISSAIVITDDITAIANLMLDLAINYTNAEKGSLMLTNDRGELYILAARGIDIQLIKTYRIKLGEGIAGTVAKTLLPVLVEDIEKDARFKEKKRDHYRTRSFISCPIVSKNKLHGVLNINDKRDGTPFTEDEFDLITIIANQAAIALENAFLMNQLRLKAAELEDINRKLIETDVAKTEFIANISHELRTPLNSIKGAIYYLQQSVTMDEDEQKEFHHIISNETGKLISIVENLLDFLRLEDEVRVVKKSIIDLSEILQEILNSKSLKVMLARKNLQLKIDIKDGLSDIVGDKIRVQQFFINLIEGLSYYLESGESIGITAEEDDFVRINVTLSRRLPKAILPYLINSRHLFHTDQPEEKLKLYLAKRVAEFHKWNLTAKNTDNTFLVSITIPKSKREHVEAVVDTTMELFIEFISELLGINICSIMLSNELTGELRIKSARGLDKDVIKRTRIKPGDRVAGWVALEGKPLLVEDIENDPRFEKRNILQYNTKSLLSLPLKTDGRVIGVLNLNNKKTAEPFTKQDLHIASLLCERISHFIERLYSNDYSEDDYKHFISSFDSLINAEKRYHKKNSLIPDLMSRLMDKLGVREEDRKAGIYISMIYDLGLMLIDDSILKKKGLSPLEHRILKVHPYTTVGLLNSFEFSEQVKMAILHHHERYDGRGYPDGLKDDEIPLISRILTVVDAFCAMITERPYKEAISRDESLNEIRKGSGTVYDPKVVAALEMVLQELQDAL